MRLTRREVVVAGGAVLAVAACSSSDGADGLRELLDDIDTASARVAEPWARLADEQLVAL